MVISVVPSALFSTRTFCMFIPLAHQRLPPFRGRDRRGPQAVGGLAAMQRLADFADRHEGAGARLLDFERLFAAALNQAHEVIQYLQRNLWRFGFGGLEGIDGFGGFFGIGHVARLIASGWARRHRTIRSALRGPSIRT